MLARDRTVVDEATHRPGYINTATALTSCLGKREFLHAYLTATGYYC